MVSFKVLKLCTSLGCKVGKAKPPTFSIKPVENTISSIERTAPSFTIGAKRAEQATQEMTGTTLLAEQNKARITIRPKNTTTDVNVESATTTTAGHRITIGKVTNPYTGHRYQLYNRTPQDLKKECDAFKLATGAELHVPSTMASDLFGDACIVLERAAKDGNFPKDIKHVLVGHGYGSSVNGDWNIINGGGNVLNYIANNPNIKEGEKVLVLCCESYGTVRGRNGIGGKVILSLTDSLHPAKIVVKGQNKIGGELYFPRLLEDNTKPSVYMYSDKPAFTIKKK